MKAAVIGIGSNSVRMLMADITGSKGVMLRRDRAGTRLFAGLDAEGRLSQASMDKTLDAVKTMAEAARADGADEVRLFATSATRDAANSDVFARRLLEEARLTLEICSGEEEAALSFRGASGEGRCGMMDIGGGSTEVVVGEGMKLDAAFSCQMGAVRLFGMHPIAALDDLAAVEALADHILCENLKAHPISNVPETWYGVGGTFTTLAAMVRGISWTERTYMHGTRITLAQAEETARLLAPMPLEKRLLLPGLQPNRADIVVHGICILTACMKRLGIKAVTVSEYGNLDGYIKHHYGVQGEIVPRERC